MAFLEKPTADNWNHTWLNLTLFWLLVIQGVGLGLRFVAVFPQATLTYKYVLYGHTHVALLGWIHSTLLIALYQCLPAVYRQRGYHWQFWLTQLSVLGMLLSFPLQGYAFWSILFSTTLLLLSYWFAWDFWRAMRTLTEPAYQPVLQWWRWALGLMCLSSVGPWSLGPLVAKGFAGKPIYHLAIYFYLHFQYNGWFTFAICGLFFWQVAKAGISLHHPYLKRFQFLMLGACLPAFLLSTLWLQPSAGVGLLAGLSAVMQLLGFGYLVLWLWPQRQTLPQALKLSPWPWFLLFFSLLALGFKLVLQVVSAFPAMALAAYQIRGWIIGYLHLTFLGFVTLFLWGYLLHLGGYRLKHPWSSIGLICFLVGLVGSETLLFGQGGALWLKWGYWSRYLLALVGISTLMPVGSFLFWVSQLRWREVSQI